jgi:hypothetical protein
VHSANRSLSILNRSNGNYLLNEASIKYFQIPILINDAGQNAIIKAIRDLTMEPPKK